MRIHAVSANFPRDVAMTTISKPDQRRSPRQSLAASRLCKHADYQRAYAASRKRQSASMSWFLAPQIPAFPAADFPDGHPGNEDLSPGTPTGPRVGLTAGKVIGKAHERNRIKRRMKEALRRHIDLLPPACDLILHPRRSVLTIEFAKLEAEIVRILQQAKTEAARMAPTQQKTTPAPPQVTQ